MEDKLRAYMDEVFMDISPTKKSVELKEEILQNLIDKYHDLINEGKSPDAAYNISIASIGDTKELLSAFQQRPSGNMSEEDYERARKKSALLTAIAVSLYILSIIPPIVFSLSSGNKYSLVFGPVLMFIMIAIATGLIIYNSMTKPRYEKMDDTIVEEFKEWQCQNDSNLRAMRSIKSAVWSVITILYIIISFTTHAWHITWVIFLVGAAIEKIIQAIFELRRQG